VKLEWKTHTATQAISREEIFQTREDPLCIMGNIFNGQDNKSAAVLTFMRPYFIGYPLHKL
jgi:hypothetical protein